MEEKNTIELSVQDRTIIVPPKYVHPVEGNVGFDEVSVSFDGEWEGLTRYASFTVVDGYPVIQLMHDEKLDIPAESTAHAGRLYVTFSGFDQDGIERVHTKRMSMPLSVDKRGATAKDEALDPTHDIVWQAVQATDAANAAADSANETVAGVKSEFQSIKTAQATEFSDAQEGRAAEFSAKQQQMAEAFAASQESRSEAFDVAQAARAETFQANQQSFNEAQQERSQAFTQSMGQWGSQVDSKAAEAAMAAQAAINAANNLAQRVEAGEFNGAAFEIKYTPESIATMQAIANPKQGEFACITSNVEDPDNSKLYMYGNGAWNYITDLSGATGIQGNQGKQGVSLKNVEVRNLTQVWVTQHDPMTEQDRTYMVGDFVAPLATGIDAAVKRNWEAMDKADYDALTEYEVDKIYMVRW